MKVATLRAMVRAMVAAGGQVAERDAALGKVPGFDAAWSVTQGVPGWFGEAEASAFWAVIHERRPNTIVEIGSYQGRSTTLLGLALKSAGVPAPRLVAIDPHTGDRQHLGYLGVDTLPSLDMFHAHVAAAGIDDITEALVDTSAAVGKTWTEPIDLLFVDGWHSYDAVVEDGRSFASHLTAAGLVCFDDYLNYDDVHAAVDDVCAELGLTVYGTVMQQAWAGHAPEAPASLTAVLRLDARLRKAASLFRRD